jgi:hypothetical protein
MAIIFSVLGLMYGLATAKEVNVVLGTIELNAGASWALTGIMFLMAYFAMVHIKD